MTKPANDTPAKPNAPNLIAYHVKDRIGARAIWTCIGGAWAHADGLGFNIDVGTVPLDGRIVIRVPSKKPE